MSITVSELLSDFYVEILDFGLKPSDIPTARLIRQIDEGQRIFAKDGRAFDYVKSINAEEDKNTYPLPDNYYSLYKAKFGDTLLTKRPSNISSYTSVAYYDIYDNQIILTGTPADDEDDKIHLYYYGLPLVSVTNLEDGIELLERHPEYQGAMVNYLLYRNLKNKAVFKQDAGENFIMFMNAVESCKKDQRGRCQGNTIMKLGY